MTPRAVYLIGAPATGKSTAMAALLDRLPVDLGPEERIYPVTTKQFHGQALESIIDGTRLGWSLGVSRDGGFPGTDALGMAASGEATKWAQEGTMPYWVIGEGRRLGIHRFLSTLARRTSLLVAHLVAPDDELDARCEARGSDQASSFRKSGATQAANVAAELERSGVNVVTIDSTMETPDDIAKVLYGHLTR